MAMDAKEPDFNHPAAAKGDGAGEVYNRQNLARYELEDNIKDEDKLVDTEERVGEGEKKAVKEKMENYIHMIQEFCNSLKYQVKFQDPWFLTTLEKDGGWVHQ
ncbi:hypothetical protein V8E53_013349, partial [Lactarius tabidus]